MPLQIVIRVLNYGDIRERNGFGLFSPHFDSQVATSERQLTKRTLQRI